MIKSIKEYIKNQNKIWEEFAAQDAEGVYMFPDIEPYNFREEFWNDNQEDISSKGPAPF